MLLPLMFLGPLCFSVSALYPLVVPLLTSTNPCFLSHSVSRLYPGNFPIVCNEELSWTAGIGKQMFSPLLPKLVEMVILSVITSWHLSLFYLCNICRLPAQKANPRHSSMFLEWYWWLQGLPFLVLLRNELYIRGKNCSMIDTKPLKGQPKKMQPF